MPCGAEPRWPRVGDLIIRAAQTIPSRTAEPLHEAGIARGRPGYHSGTVGVCGAVRSADSMRGSEILRVRILIIVHEVWG